MVMLAIGSQQENPRNVHMSGVADRAGSVANALNLNAGVVVGVVARMVAAKNENKTKNKNIFIFKQELHSQSWIKRGSRSQQARHVHHLRLGHRRRLKNLQQVRIIAESDAVLLLQLVAPDASQRLNDFFLADVAQIPP
jgi:hypothetical protein